MLASSENLFRLFSLKLFMHYFTSQAYSSREAQNKKTTQIRGITIQSTWNVKKGKSKILVYYLM